MSEETVDPAKTAPVTLTRTIEGAGITGSSGIPGTPSNLPRPVAAPPATTTGVGRQTENVTYQNSRTVRHTKLPQGTIRKLSVALLIDHQQRWEGTGANAKRVTEPPPPERLKAIRDVVAGAVGLNAERGDQLIVESLPFETTLPPPPPSGAPGEAPRAQPSLPFPLPAWIEKLVKESPTGVLVGIGAGALLLLISGLAVLVILRRRHMKKISAETAKALPGGGSGPAAIAGGDDDAELERQLQAQLAEQQALKERQAAEVLNSLKIQTVKTKKTEVLTKQISEETKKDPASVAYIVRGWLNEGE